MSGAHVVEALMTREVLVQFHGGACVERGTEGGAVMLSKHVHLDLGLESTDKREAGFGVGEGGNSGRKVQETVDVRVEVAGLPIGNQGGPVVKHAVAVRVPVGEDLHQLGVGVGGGLGGDAESAFLE